jgi:hypothetical protein
MRSLIFIVTIFLFVGCSKTFNSGSNVAFEDKGTKLSFQTLIQDARTFNNQNLLTITLRSKQDEQEFFKIYPPATDFPEVDYNAKMVIGILGGWRSSISIQIMIDSLAFSDNKIRVFSHEYIPSGQRQEPGNPVHMIIIDRTSLPVIFEDVKVIRENTQEYVLGQVVVKTKANISLNYFLKFIDSLGIKVLSRDYDRVYLWIEVPNDSVTHFIILLSREFQLFTGVTESNYPYSDGDLGKKYLFAVYKTGQDASDIADGKIFIEKLGLKIKRVNVMPMEGEIHAVLGVPEGDEITWINKLKSYPFIKYAELNYVYRIWK